MGFRVELKMRIEDPYTDQVAPMIQGAMQQFVAQYNSSVSECDIQILPDIEVIPVELPPHTPEEPPV